MEHDGREIERTNAWPRLNRRERFVVALTAGLVLLVAWPRLPPGICYGDAGDLQTACATLGIAHPPGYMGFAAVGWLLCRLFFFIEPAYVVSIACLACITLVITLVTVLLVRLGSHVLVAAALGLLLLSHPRIWQSATVPEVYAPTLLCLTGSLYLLLKYSRLFRARDLYLAAALFGFGMINRPPLLFMLPGFLIALWLIERQKVSPPRPLRAIGRATLAAAIPMIATLVLLLVRDTASNPYNYIDQYEEVFGIVPARDGAISTAISRITWLVSGKQFGYLMGTDLPDMVSKLGWLRGELFLTHLPALLLALVVIVAATVVLARRNLECLCVSWGIGLGALIFILQYQLVGQAADVLPILLVAVVIAGSGLAAAYPRPASRTARALSAMVFVGAAVWTAYHSATRYSFADDADATAYLQRVDFPSLPEGTTICVIGETSQPLFYASLVSTDRSDVHVITDGVKSWPELAPPSSDRPVFYAGKAEPPAGWILIRWNNLWRLVPDESSGDGLVEVEP